MSGFAWSSTRRRSAPLLCRSVLSWRPLVVPLCDAGRRQHRVGLDAHLLQPRSPNEKTGKEGSATAVYADRWPLGARHPARQVPPRAAGD